MTIDQALDLIALKIPTLAARASKIKSRPNATLKAKAINTLIGEALASESLTTKDRTALAAIVKPITDKTRSTTIPAVRVTSAQYKELTEQAEALGKDLSALIRFKLFGEDQEVL